MLKSEIPTTEEILSRLEILKLHLETLLFHNDVVMEITEIETATTVLNLVHQLILWSQQNL